MKLAVGDRVFIRSVGLGDVTGHAGRSADGQPCNGGPPYFYVVQGATQQVFAPIETADNLLRLLFDEAQAHRSLAILRVAHASPPDDALAEARRIMSDGSPDEHARFLRQLYALPEVTHRDGMMILTFEDMVLNEIAEVTGLDLDELTNEMRERYPAMARKIAANRAGTD